MIARRASAVKELETALALAQPTLALDGQQLLAAIGRVHPRLGRALEEAEGAGVDSAEVDSAKVTLEKWKQKFSAQATDCVTHAATAGDLILVQRVFRTGSALGCSVVQQSRVQDSDHSVGMLMAFSGDMDILQVTQRSHLIPAHGAGGGEFVCWAVAVDASICLFDALNLTRPAIVHACSYLSRREPTCQPPRNQGTQSRTSAADSTTSSSQTCSY